MRERRGRTAWLPLLGSRRAYASLGNRRRPEARELTFVCELHFVHKRPCGHERQRTPQPLRRLRRGLPLRRKEIGVARWAALPA